MPSDPEVNGGTRRDIAALLLMQAGMYTLDAYGTLNSSPWTAENAGADPQKYDSLKWYVINAMAVSTIYCGAAAYIAKSLYPLIGATVNNLYLWWLYNRATAKALQSGSTGFPNIGGQTNQVRSQ